MCRVHSIFLLTFGAALGVLLHFAMRLFSCRLGVSREIYLPPILRSFEETSWVSQVQ